MGIDGSPIARVMSLESVSPECRVSTSTIESMLKGLVRDGKVDRDDFAIAKRVLESDRFQEIAHSRGREVAEKFLAQYKNKLSSVPKPRSKPKKYEPGKYYSIVSPAQNPPPDGWVWDLHGLDSTKPGNVLAKLTRAPLVPGKIYSIESTSNPRPPDGFAWGLIGACPETRGNILAKLVPISGS